MALARWALALIVAPAGARYRFARSEDDPIRIANSWPVGYVTWKLLEMKARAGPETAPVVEAKRQLGSEGTQAPEAA